MESKGTKLHKLIQYSSSSRVSGSIRKRKPRSLSSLNEVEATVWKHPNPPPYGLGGRSVVIRNYYYLYTFISPTRSTVWAIPVGPKPEEANTYFLILTPDDREKWKGPAFDLKEVADYLWRSYYSQLALLGMIKQDPLPQKRK